MVTVDDHYLLPHVNLGTNPSPIFFGQLAHTRTTTSEGLAVMATGYEKGYPHSCAIKLDQPQGAWFKKDEKWGAIWDQQSHSFFLNHDSNWDSLVYRVRPE